MWVCSCVKSNGAGVSQEGSVLYKEDKVAIYWTIVRIGFGVFFLHMDARAHKCNTCINTDTHRRHWCAMTHDAECQ